MLIEKS
jgi:serine/threonine-protein phosphatase PP1 catalytic subunit